MKKLAVIGLGYVGLPLAVEFGKKRQVVGFDINHRRVEELDRGVDCTGECSPDELALASGLEFTSDTTQISDAQIYIVTVPTPVNSDNEPDLEPLKSASATVGQVVTKGDIVIYESTVYPGATEEVCVPIIERESGLAFNEDFFCGYSPERINPGDKVNTITTITKITSGSLPEIAAEVDELYASIISAGTFLASSIKVAEAAKVIENSQRDLNIAFVNELSMIFERIGIDSMEVLDAASTKWNFHLFRPGMVGGHCIGVDPYYLIHKAQTLGVDPKLMSAGRSVNNGMAPYAASHVVSRMRQNGIDPVGSVVGVLGITFKENCPDTRNSKVIDLVEELRALGVRPMVLDHWVNGDDDPALSDIELVADIEPGTLDSLIVAVGHSDFRAMSASQLRRYCKPDITPVLGDLKSLYTRDECEKAGFVVFRL